VADSFIERVAQSVRKAPGSMAVTLMPTQAVHDARAQDEHPDGVEVGDRVVGQQHVQRILEFPWPPVDQRLLALGVCQHGGQIEGAVGSVRVFHAIRTSGAG
jgi:hypothetical protein